MEKTLFRNEIEFDLEKNSFLSGKYSCQYYAYKKLIKESLHWMVRESVLYAIKNELFVSACDFRKSGNKCYFI